MKNKKGLPKKDRKLLVPKLATKFSKEFSKVIEDYTLKEKIELTNFFIDYAELHEDFKTNRSEIKSSLKNDFEKFKTSETVPLLVYFRQDEVLMKYSVGEGNDYFYTHDEFNALGKIVDDEQELSDGEYKRLLYFILNILNSNRNTYGTEKKKNERFEEEYLAEPPELTSAKESFEFLKQLGFLETMEFKSNNNYSQNSRIYFLAKILRVSERTAKGFINNEKKYAPSEQLSTEVKIKLLEKKLRV